MVQFGVTRRADGILRRHALFDGDKRLAAGERDQTDSPEWFAILGGHQRDGDLVPGLEGRLPPAKTDHFSGILSLSNPVHYLAAFILRVELKQAMRIGPIPFRDATLQREYIIH